MNDRSKKFDFMKKAREKKTETGLNNLNLKQYEKFNWKKTLLSIIETIYEILNLFAYFLLTIQSQVSVYADKFSFYI